MNIKQIAEALDPMSSRPRHQAILNQYKKLQEMMNRVIGGDSYITIALSIPKQEEDEEGNWVFKGNWEKFQKSGKFNEYFFNWLEMLFDSYDDIGSVSVRFIGLSINPPETLNW